MNFKQLSKPNLVLYLILFSNICVRAWQYKKLINFNRSFLLLLVNFNSPEIIDQNWSISFTPFFENTAIIKSKAKCTFSLLVKPGFFSAYAYFLKRNFFSLLFFILFLFFTPI